MVGFNMSAAFRGLDYPRRRSQTASSKPAAQSRGKPHLHRFSAEFARGRWSARRSPVAPRNQGGLPRSSPTLVRHGPRRALTLGWALSSSPHPAEPGVAPTKTHFRVLFFHLGEI